MFTETDFEVLVADVARINGITSDQASEYCALVGDMPELSYDQKNVPAGAVRIVVRDESGAAVVEILFPVEEDQDEEE